MRLLTLSLALAACGSSPRPPAEFPPLPGEAPPAPAGDASCMPAGLYRVSVDLSSAKITASRPPPPAVFSYPVVARVAGVRISAT